MIVGRRDTIAAIATPVGSGGIGIVRISGPTAVEILAALLKRPPESLPNRQLVYGIAHDKDGIRLDEVLGVVMYGPNSFTGEDVAELHGHGGAINMARLLRAAIEAGARHAEAGEYTRRAFENGRLDLTRAEAIADVIEASSERMWRLAQGQLQGGLAERIAHFRGRATELLAQVEACIDFPEEGEVYMGRLELADKARHLAAEIDELAQTFSLGKALRNGAEVAIVGAVNAGKSSLFNALVGRERAIVDASPGTTRDFIEAVVTWNGIKVTVIDTAGEREAENRIEQQGIELGRKRAEEADIVLNVYAADALPRERIVSAMQKLKGDRRQLSVITKADLLSGEYPGLRRTSAWSGEGIKELKEEIISLVCGNIAEGVESYVITSERQRALLEGASTGFARAASSVTSHLPIELIAVEIREATQRLAEIVGEQVGEEVLDELFQRFCIGK